MSRLQDAVLAGLTGRGIEIGAYHSPLPVGPGADVTYVDACSPEVARRYFPEVDEAAKVVAPSVLAPADRLPLPDRSQDFVLSSHVIEHIADPIGALREWHRVLRPGGTLFMKVPDMRGTFDRDRERTSVAHLIADHREPQESPERRGRDLEHYRDWARRINALVDPAQVDFWARLLMRLAYPIHFHCWIPEDMRAVFADPDAVGGRFDVFGEDSREDRYEFTIAARANA